MNLSKLFKIKLSSIQYLLVLAAIVYFFLSVLTYHTDNKQVLFWASIDGVKLVNVWQVGAQKYPTISQFNYPPAHYVIDKFLYFVAKPLAGPGYDQWLGAANDADRFLPQLSRFAFATKAGLILLGLFSGYLVYRLVEQMGNKKQAVTAASLWLFNPITLYSLPMMGQNDVIAICFFLLGWLTLKKKKVLATLLFGIATSVKMIPIIWLPFLLVTTSRKNWIKKLFIFLGAGLFYVVTLLPFLSNENFQKSILTGNHNQRFLFAQISFGFSEAVYIIPLLLMLLLAGVFTHTVTKEKQLSLSSFTLMIVNMLMLSFTHFHPQWWTWVVLFWAMWITTVDAKKIGAAVSASFISFCCWFVILVLFNDKALNVAMLMPLNANLVNLPTIRSILLARGTDIEQLVKLAYTWLAGISIISLGLVYKDDLPAVHDKIVLPKLLKSILLKVISNNIIRKLSITTFLVLVFVTLSAIAQTVPAPLASEPPDSKRHRPLTTRYQATFNPKHNYLERFDLYLSDLTLESSDRYIVQVDQDNQEIYRQTIQGENVGFDSLVRFDIPPQDNKQAGEYTISITPENNVTENIIQVGITDPNDPTNSLAIRPYFSPIGNNTIFDRTINTIKNIVNQSSMLFITLGLAIVLFA